MAALLEAAAAGEPEALAGLAHVGKWLGIGLAGLINVLNPSLVVLGGLFERIHPFVSDQLADVLERRALPPPASSGPSCPAHSAWTQRWVPRSTHSNRCWPIRRLGSPSSAPDGRRWRALDVMAASGSIAPVSSVSDLEAQRGGA